MNYNLLIILCGAGSVFLWIVAIGNLGAAPRFRERYQVFSEEHRRREMEPETTPFFERFLFPVFDNLSRWFQSFTQEAMIDTARQRLQTAGLANSMPPLRFIGLNLFTGFALALLVGFLAWRSNSANPMLRFVLPVLVFVAGRNLPMFILARKAEARKHQILKDLPYVLDLLTVSVEAGLGFDAALAEVTNHVSGPLGSEFKWTLREIRLGRNRVDALQDLPKRTGVQELRSVVAVIIHVFKSGGSLAHVLRIQAESVRNKRKQVAEEQAMRAPVKVLFPLIFFIFPAIWVIIFGPIGVQMTKIFSATR